MVPGLLRVAPTMNFIRSNLIDLQRHADNAGRRRCEDGGAIHRRNLTAINAARNEQTPAYSYGLRRFPKFVADALDHFMCQSTGLLVAQRSARIARREECAVSHRLAKS